MITIDQVIEYVITTPCNSNPSVLRSLLTKLIEDNAEPSPEPGPTPGPEDTIIYDGGTVKGW